MRRVASIGITAQPLFCANCSHQKVVGIHFVICATFVSHFSFLDDSGDEAYTCAHQTNKLTPSFVRTAPTVPMGKWSGPLKPEQLVLPLPKFCKRLKTEIVIVWCSF